ncbi:MAG: hypothetical protein HUU25_15080, partial [Candidatus Sumerlaeia bacterium]|nr:hypothetical protein [Candidatus Sumerlaeia bacterium]
MLPTLPLQAEFAQTAAGPLSPEVDQARQSVMGEVLSTGLWALGLLIVTFVVIRVVRRLLFAGPELGDGISPMTLKQMYERDLINTEEYHRLKKAMAARVAAQLAEDRRRREEERRAKAPVAARLAQQA